MLRKSFHLILIFGLAAIFRLSNLNLIEFKEDEAITVFQLTEFYIHPYLIQVGPIQSTGVYNFPLYHYLMIILSLFSRYPLYLSFLIALINVFTIGGFYLLVRKYYGVLTGFLSAIFLSLSPWNIIFSRKIWIPDLLIPFVVLSLYFLHKLVIDRKKLFTFGLFLTLILLSQMHVSGIFFSLIVVITLLVFKVSIDKKQALKAIIIGLIPAIPYFIRQVTSDPFCIDCNAFLKYQFSERTFDFGNFLVPFQIINGLNFKVLLGEDYHLFLQQFRVLDVINIVFVIEFMLPILGAIYLLITKLKFRFLLIFLVLPIIYFFSRTPAYMHYYIVISPIMFILSAFSIKFLVEKINNIYGKIAAVIIVSIIVLNLLFFNFFFFKFIDNRQVINGDYGPVFSVTENFINQELQNYLFWPQYEELKAYAYYYAVRALDHYYAKPKIIHQKLGEYFIQKNQPELAILEFKKALEINNHDIFSLANLSLIYLKTNQLSAAEKEINTLSNLDSSLSAKLYTILNQSKERGTR